jgi:hypothetical protein
VLKSATAVPGERPTAYLHYESFLIERPAIAPESIVLIDDVVTKGRTLLAAATRLQEAFPGAQIRAFALVRTMGLISGVQQLLDPAREKSDGRPVMRTAALSVQAGSAREAPARLIAQIPEMEKRYLRVILLADAETVHNGFFDRRFVP